MLNGISGNHAPSFKSNRLLSPVEMRKEAHFLGDMMTVLVNVAEKSPDKKPLIAKVGQKYTDRFQKLLTSQEARMREINNILSFLK